MAVVAPGRVKYTAEQLEQVGTEGMAMRTGGSYSHPIVDDDDFAKAVGVANTPELRAFVVERALVMGKLGALADWPEAPGEYRRDYSDEQRQEMAKKGEALSDGSYPIKDRADLQNAIQAVGRAKDRGRALAHIKKRAAALGLSELLPDDWRSADAPAEGMGLEQRKRKAEAMRGAREERHYPARDLEVRERADGGINMTGYASVTGTPYPMAWYEEPLALATPVPTPRGWSTIGDLRVGDEVFGSDGKPCRVEHESPVFRDRDCYRVTFTDGEEIVASGSHGWTLERLAGDRFRSVTTTTEAMARDYIRGQRKRYRMRTVAMDTPDIELPVDPYLLGLWLGDGTAGANSIAFDWRLRDEVTATLSSCLGRWERIETLHAGGNKGIIRIVQCAGVCTRGHVIARTKVFATGVVAAPGARERCRQCGRDKARGRYGHDRRFTARLRRIGVLRDKHIPMSYLRASIAQRQALLQGLIDSDGTVDGSRTPADGRRRVGGQVSFPNTNRRLIDGCCELLTSLGHKWGVREATHNAPSWAPQWDVPRVHWQVNFTPSTDVPVARLAHKARNQSRASYSRYRHVACVERVPSVPVQCIGIDTPDHLFLVGRRAVLTHNTMAPGAFKRTLKDDPDVVLLLNHEGLPLARTKAGTLALEEDKRGLRVDADLDPGDPDTQRLVRKLARGDLDGQMSFAFQATDEDWNEEHTERTIRSVSLHRGDVSIVTHGANPATTAAISRETLIDTLRAGASAALEYRAGKVISAANEAKITQALSEASSADDALDSIQATLAEVLGVANPDDDEDEGPREQPIMSISTGGASEALSAPPDEVARARRELEILNWGQADG